MTKYCPQCKETKKVTEFYKDRTTADKLCAYCKSCQRLNHKRSREEDDGERDRKQGEKYRREHPNRQAEYYQKNKKVIKASVAAYQKENAGKMQAIIRNRRAGKIHRTPGWADLKAIEQFYKDCPKGMTVDHIVPLQGKLVSGLHVLSNLQYLTRSQNSSKGNKFEPKTLNFN